jgi:hypothetical protein
MSQMFRSLAGRLRQQAVAGGDGGTGSSPTTAGKAYFQSFFDQQQQHHGDQDGSVASSRASTPGLGENMRPNGNVVVRYEGGGPETPGVGSLVLHARECASAATASSPYGARPASPQAEQAAALADLVCSYCRKLMTAEREPLLLRCGHSFCRECVELWPMFPDSATPAKSAGVPVTKRLSIENQDQTMGMEESSAEEEEEPVEHVANEITSMNGAMVPSL